MATALATSAAFAVLGAAAISAVAGDGNDATTTAAKSPRASVKLRSCVSAPMYTDRRLVFRGSMRSAGFGGTMEMRYSLLRRYDESRSKAFRTVNSTAENMLGKWLPASDSAATVYIHNLTIVPVETSAAYRVKVRYRWRDADGKIVARAKRTSKLCKQRTGLPNLVVSNVKRYPNPGRFLPHLPVIYEATITNRGRSSSTLPVGSIVSGAVQGVSLVDGTADSPSLGQQFDALPAGESTVRTLYGPACDDGELTLTVDPANNVREAKDDDNVHTGRC